MLRSPNLQPLPASDALDRLAADWLASLAPPTLLTVSQWADEHRYLSPEASAEPGRWDTSRTPYLAAVMDAMSEPTVTRVVCAKSSQIGYTESLNNVVGYFIDQDPAPILCVVPTVEAAESWSKDRLAPMLRDCPALAAKVSGPRARDAEGTLRMKTFPGGRLSIVGANSPAGLASRPIRIVVFDEVDRFPISAGSEGDPLSLAAKRQSTFWNKKTLVGSTPTLKGTSVIWREWEQSDMRKYFVPCPDCDHRQVLRWSGVVWDKAADGRHLPDTATYCCEHCGSAWDDAARHSAVSRGEWKAMNPEGTPGTVGFHINVLMSPWVALPDVVREFLSAKDDPSTLQVFINTSLGEPFERAREKVEATGLQARGENYGPHSIPDPVKFLTAGVDVQGDRLETLIVGWGPFEESWMVHYAVLPGDPAQAHVWDQLDEVIRRPYHAEDGRELRVKVACVDSGGHHAHQVLSYCARRPGIMAIKGIAGPRPIWPPRSSRTRTNHRVFMVGTDTAKDVLYSRLRFDAPGPGFVHFPVGGAFDPEFFRQLTSEEVSTRFNEGRPYRVWMLPPGRRNEALDCAVYSLAARTALPYRLDDGPKPPPKPPMLPFLPQTGHFEPADEAPPPGLQIPARPRSRNARRRRLVVRSNYLSDF